MTKIDLEEIEASLGYLEDWKNVLNELRAAREVVEAARKLVDATEGLCGATDCEDLTQITIDKLKKLDEARRG
jgi:hypothetical protein